MSLEGISAHSVNPRTPNVAAVEWPPDVANPLPSLRLTSARHAAPPQESHAVRHGRGRICAEVPPQDWGGREYVNFERDVRCFE